MEAFKGLAQLPHLGLGAEALEGLLGGLTGLARRRGGAGLFGVGVRREADEVGAVVLGRPGLRLGRSGLPLGGGLGRFRRRGLRRCLARFGRLARRGWLRLRRRLTLWRRLALGRLLGLRLRLWRSLDRLAVDRRRRGLCLGLLHRALVGRQRLGRGRRLAGRTLRLGRLLGRLLGWLWLLGLLGLRRRCSLRRLGRFGFRFRLLRLLRRLLRLRRRLGLGLCRGRRSRFGLLLRRGSCLLGLGGGDPRLARGALGGQGGCRRTLCLAGLRRGVVGVLPENIP